MSRLQIAINTRHWIPGQMEGIGRYVMNLADRISKAHPEADFHFIFDRKVKFNHDFPKNVSLHTVFPPARHVYVYPYWYNIGVSKLLKKIKADIFLSLDNMYSLKCPCKGITVIHDINFEHYPDNLPSNISKYYRNNTPKFIEAASKVITVSQFSKDDIVSTYRADANKIEIVYNGLGSFFKPRTEKEKSETRHKFSTGRPYFLILGSINPRKNVLRTIEAYAEFRKRSKENIALLISGRPMWRGDETASLIEKTPFKEDVFFTGYLSDEQLGQVVGAAEALLYMSYFEGFGVPVIEAFASGVPVVAGNRSVMPKTCGGAALLTNPFDVSDIASALDKILEENLRKELIAKGLERAKDFSWDKSAEKLWDIIQEVILKK
ncbi:MAG: hypothetical protein C0592_00600 [Marinilabiliales bacterium]|nr:MAG: hypothetical protein C0592_00600 [Marinilabiliales bacterium]